MRKLVLKVLLLIGICILMLNFIFDPIFRDNSVNSKTFVEFQNLEKDSLDILILGSSHAKNAYNPSVIDSILGTKTFNLGSGGQNFISTRLLLSDIVEKFNPKLIIIDIFPTLLKTPELEKSKASQLRILDYIDISFEKIKAINAIYSFYEIPSVFSETIRNHDRWFEANWRMDEFDVSNDNFVFNKGYFNTYRTIPKNERKNYLGFVSKHQKFGKLFPSKGELEVFEKEAEELKKVLNIIKNYNSEVLFVSAPYFDSFFLDGNNKKHIFLKNFFQRNEMDYVDFNLAFNELGLGFNHFWDKGHLNDEGSHKVSTLLAEKITELKGIEVTNELYLVQQKAKIKPRKAEEINNALEESRRRKIQMIVETGRTFELNHRLNDSIQIRNLTYSLNGGRFIAIEAKSDINLDNKYFLISKTVYEEDMDRRPKWQLNTDNDKLHWEVIPEKVEFKGQIYILLSFNMKCEIKNFKEARIVLKNLSTKKTEGTPIIIKDFKNR